MEQPILFILLPFSSRNQSIQVFKGDPDVATKLDTTKKLVLIVHGYTDNKDRRWIRRMIRDIPLYTDSNTCVVDWSKVATTQYTLAVAHLNRVGETIGDFLISLESQFPLDRVSIVGHSLGAHIAGAAGARTGSKIDAIFGLDPAHPLVTIPMRPTSERLDPSDAQFVQVLHTTSGIAGTPFNIGHQDWYADDGRTPQKGCEPGLIMFDPTALASVSLLCSHMRALEIFRFALDRGNQFKNSAGDDVYGYWSRRSPGVFQFPTKRDRPYV